MTNARIEAHWAAQLAAAPGTTLLPKAADDSNTNLGWDPKLRALVGHLGVGIRLEDLTLLAGNESLPLDKKTVKEALAWLAKKLEVAELRLPEHDMPPHSGTFTLPDPAELIALAREYAIAHEALDVVHRKVHGASPVRCWPHHFDIATLITVTRDRTIGAGMSPGDASYADPYWYVTPWPYPPADTALPPLPEGHWHREGWTGAIYQGEEHPGDFFAAAIKACQSLHMRAASADTAR